MGAALLRRESGLLLCEGSVGAVWRLCWGGVTMAWEWCEGCTRGNC